MSIADTISSMAQNLQSAYNNLEAKGAKIPSNRNIANLADAMETLPDRIPSVSVKPTLVNNDDFIPKTWSMPASFHGQYI